MLALLLAVLLASPALDQARAALDKGKLDDVLFALQPVDSVPSTEAKAAAEVLVGAAKLAKARGDKPMALQLAQMALKRDGQCGAALRLLADWSLEESEFNLAIKYAQRWTEAEPGSADAKQFLARAEEQERNWRPIEIREGKRRKKRAPRAQPLAATTAPARSWGQATTPAPSGRVVLYGTSWCGVCARARSWLNEKGIAFEDKDIEADRSAALELHRKEREAKMGHRGVPVIEVNGKLQPAGFSPAAIEWALRHGS